MGDILRSYRISVPFPEDISVSSPFFLPHLAESVRSHREESRRCRGCAPRRRHHCPPPQILLVQSMPHARRNAVSVVPLTNAKRKRETDIGQPYCKEDISLVE